MRLASFFVPMTLDEFQTKVAILYGDDEAPDEGSPEWDQRLIVANDAVDDWQHSEGMLWNELYTTLAAEDADITDGTTTQFDTPADFKHIQGFVRLLDNDGQITSYDVLPSQDAQLWTGETSANFVYITGSFPNIKINFLQAPEAGQTLDYAYYKEATHLAAADDSFEMSNPQFAVYRALAYLASLNDDYDRLNLHMQKCEDMLVAMRLRNVQLGYHQQNVLPDDTEGFGY